MYKNFFPRAQQVTYLDTAAEGLLLARSEEAFSAYCRTKARGTPGRADLHAAEAETLRLIARLLGTDPANVAFVASATDALNLLALSRDWTPGDQVIISDLEFPSNVFPWLRLRRMGVEVIVVPGRDGTLHEEDVIARMTSHTRMVSLSLVSYKTGAYLPNIGKLTERAHQQKAIVSLDATQALGRCPVSLSGVDYLMSSSFKWLLGSHGLGIIYISPEFRKEFNPASVGWYSVKDLFSPDRFKSYELKDGAACLSGGMPNFPSIYALQQGLEFLLEAGVDRVNQELKPLVAHLRQGLSELRVQLLTPGGDEYASGIVAFEHPKAREIGATLERKGVIVWAGDGRVRASVHVYNDMADIERYLETLKPILNQ
jgi:cysteine desulfurase/selenocysteine lyase